MWPTPRDPDLVRRMRTAHRRARQALLVQLGSSPQEAWGWHGRTLGTPVIADGELAWLRLASAPAGRSADIFWSGSIDAERTLPGSIPRPRLRCWHDFATRHWQYRAELFDRLPTDPASPAPVLTEHVDLPASWWTAVRAALAEMAAVATDRRTVCQQFLDHAMPRLLGTPVNTTAPSRWAAAHGDFHFANICAPSLHILDFEGWGMAPEGYDAATLHAFSLLVPTVADRIRYELAYLLDNPAGRFAELVVITERLHVACGERSALTELLCQRASVLLGRAIPGPQYP